VTGVDGTEVETGARKRWSVAAEPVPSFGCGVGNEHFQAQVYRSKIKAVKPYILPHLYSERGDWK
jgi:hypothetical protein